VAAVDRDRSPANLVRQLGAWHEYNTVNRGLMRAILTSLLMLAATSAWAEWAKVTETTDAVFYVDPASISKSGNLRQVWVIQDYTKPEPNGTRSRRLSFEIDCAAERLRSVSATEHSEPMASGSILNSRNGESDWIYVAPRTGSNIPRKTPNRIILRFVCHE
jgi:hypothetical protein